MRVKRGKGGKGKGGKKGDKKSNRKKTQWGDEDKDNFSRDDPGLSDEEIQVAKRGLPPRQTQEKYDKLYRVMKRQKELETRRAFGEKMRPHEIKMEKKQRRVRSKIMTQHLPSQEEPRPCLTNISDDDDDVVCGSEVEDNNTSTYQQHVLDVNDLGNYFADKDDEEEEEVFAVRRKECNEVVNGSSYNNKEEQEHGRVVCGDENTKQDSITCQDGGVVDGDDGECTSTETMTVANPGAADSTPYALRFMNFGTLPQDSTAKLLQERPVFHKPAPDKNLDDLCQCLGLEVAYCQNEKEEEDSKGGWNLPLSSEAVLTQSCGIHPLLARQWKGGKSKLSNLILTPLLAYRDLVYCAEMWEDWKELQRLYSLHILNHVISARRIVTNTNRRLRRLTREQGEVRAAEAERGKGRAKKMRNKRKINSKKLKQEPDHDDIRQDIDGTPTPVHIGDDGDEDKSEDWKRDQGYTRPIVLLLCPMRHWAYSVVSTMISLLGPDASVANLKRFEEEFGSSEEEENEDGDNDMATLTPKQRRDAFIVKQKPKDWQALFGKGLNCDDDFKLGISITLEGGKTNTKKGGSRGIGVRLFSNWYQSDIIIASPLGLMLLIQSSDGDADLLSSIEVCIVDGSDVLAMQNWGHVMSALERCNKMPTSQHDIDFSRVRSYHLHGQSSLIRQMIFMGAVSDASLNACITAYSRNTKGCMKERNKVIQNRNGTDGAAMEVLVNLEQVFQRVPCNNVSNVNDARFQYFEKIVLPSLLSSENGHNVLFVPNYYDFVRVRNVLLRQEANAVFISEYSRVSEIARGRARFFSGQKPILVYSGRAHFFHRYRIRGAQRIIFYSPPPHALFYLEMLNALEDCGGGGGLSSLVLYARYDVITLTPLLGGKRAKHMLLGSEETFIIQ